MTSTTAPTGAPNLPSPVPIPGTSDGGSDGFLGTAERVPVVAVPVGSDRETLPEPGSPAFGSVSQIAYRRFGGGPDLLLIMGQDGTMSWWEPSILAALATHYTVTIFDLPGVGYSDAAEAQASLGWLADETAGLVASLGLDHPAVLGWGLGGDVAVAMAYRHPGSVSSLVLVDSAAGGPGAVRPETAVTEELDSPYASPSSLANVLFAPPNATSSAAEQDWLTGVSSGVPDDITAASITEESTVATSVWSEGLSGSLAAIRVPVLVMYGNDALLDPSPDGEALAAAIPGAQTLSVPGSGYAAMCENTSGFTSKLEAFTA